MSEQEILSKIAFIQLMQKNYNGDGLELKQGDIALVSNEKCYDLFKDTPDKFEKIDFKDISTDTLKHIYDNRNKLIEKDDGRLIYESDLYSLLGENSLNLKENSEIVIPEKIDTPKSFDDELARMLFEKESEQLWRDADSEKANLLSRNLTPMGNIPTNRYISILEVYKKLGVKLVKLRFDTDKVVLKKSKIIFDSKIRPFLNQRIRVVINQWSETSKIVIQELLPNTKDAKAKNFLISLLIVNTKEKYSNFERELDIQLRMNSPKEEHFSSKKYWFWWGIAAFIGAIAGMLYILEYFNIRP